MKQSIKKKFTIIGGGMIGGFIIINIVLTYLFMIPFSVKLNTGQLEKLANEIGKQSMNDEQGFQEYIDLLEEDMNTRIMIVDSKGTILFSTTDKYHKNDALHEKSPETKLFIDNKEKLDQGKAVSSNREGNGDNNTAIRIFLVRRVGVNRYAILSRSYRSFQNAMKSAILFEIVAGCVLLVLGIFIVHRWSLHFVKPIKQIRDTAEHISNLEFDTKVEVKTEDELGQLANSINRMSDHLEANVVQLQEDIENRKRLVRNLSHEIKSPIAVIMGYADRMRAVISKNPDKALQYCEIISDESSRVDLLVREMLELSKLEQESDELNREKIETVRLFTDLNKRFHQEYMETRITYQDQYDREEYFYADYLLVERAVYNLIRNAATYVAGERPVIRVNGATNGAYYEVRVFNSGSFIPEEDRKSIWEPFSKVDKARSRSKKGFGVGLSIVREIVEKHDGYYGVENMEDGVAFLVAFRDPR